MTRELFKTILAEFMEEEIQTGTRREQQPLTNNQAITTIIGGRRTGKTTLLKQIINELIKKGIPKENIIYINFEDERIPRETKIFQELLEAHAELHPNTETNECWYFFDEIQEIPGWEHFIRRFHENKSKHIFITGSNAKLLSKEIATALRGRTISYEIYPFSFREYLTHKGQDPEKQHTTNDKATIRRELYYYLEEGGYPETIGQTTNIRTKTLKAYLDVMIYRDLIERYNISNHNALKQYIKKMLANTAKEASTHKTYQELKSQGYKISKDQIYNYQEWCEEIYLLFMLPQHHESLTKQQAGSKKTYGIDTGLINNTSFKTSQDKGRIMENAVFLELKRREKETYYNKEGKECDFLIKEKDKITQAIQVTLTLEEETTRKRELAGLLHTMNKYGLQQGTIITLDEEETITKDNKTITIQPLWKWLLKKETQINIYPYQKEI